ncbi:Endo-1,4-beta-xylanase A precursor [compost metagenome]
MQAKLIQGFEDGTFRPHASITRQEMAVMIARAASFSGKAASVPAVLSTKFADHGAVASWASDSVAQCVGSGIIQGKGDAIFAPKDATTRAEASTMLQRMLVHLEFIQ